MKTATEVSTALCDLARAMVLALIDDGAEAHVASRDVDGCIVIDVSVAASEVGKVIGKQGRTARALRTILYAAAQTAQTRCELNLNEAPTGTTEAAR